MRAEYFLHEIISTGRYFMYICIYICTVFIRNFFTMAWILTFEFIARSSLLPRPRHVKHDFPATSGSTDTSLRSVHLLSRELIEILARRRRALVALVSEARRCSNFRKCFLERASKILFVLFVSAVSSLFLSSSICGFAILFLILSHEFWPLFDLG